MFSPQNVDRLHTMLKGAAQSQRSFVLDPYSLFVLHLMKSESGMPDPFDVGSTLRVCFPRGRGKERAGPFKRVWGEVTALEIIPEEMLASLRIHDYGTKEVEALLHILHCGD